MSAPALQPSSSPYRFYIWVGFVLVLFLAFMRLILPSLLVAPAALPKIRQVPIFTLTERSGRAITHDHLAGKISVFSFFFTSCPGPCPTISANMAKIQNVFSQDDRVQLVSITVDPEDDTPAVLGKYADHYGADPNKWWFLTGQEKIIYDLIFHGFTQIVADNRGKKLDEGEYVFTHSTYLTVVDGDGWIRGFYNGVTDEGRLDTIKAIRQLEREGK